MFQEQFNEGLEEAFEGDREEYLADADPKRLWLFDELDGITQKQITK